jgi:hypothetical protein
VPLPHHVALVSMTREVSTHSLMQVAAALQKQVTRDFTPIWGVPATVDAFDNLFSVPNDYLPVVVFGDAGQLANDLEAAVGEQMAGRLVDAFERGEISGVHLNALTRQPFALVSASDAWTVKVSHETLEMLADPWGNRLVAAAHPTEPQERVKYLIEVCDPCLSVWYPVNGVPMTDFYTPRYFDPVEVSGVRYSYTGAIERPRQILDGGYLTFLDPADSRLYQQHWNGGEPVVLAELTELASSTVPLRTIVDTHPQTPRVTPDVLRAAEKATAALPPYKAVAEASEGAALCTAEALYSLATGAG